MDNDIAIRVEHVNKEFKLPHERQTSIKGLLINVLRGKHKRSFERQKVLTDVSFDIKKGDFFGIVGRNGNGKSTLLKLLAGIYTPDSGAIHVNGKLTPFIELGVGFNPELTGRENVFLNGALLGFSRSEMETMYDDIVSFAELERFMDQRLKNYSSGMQVRLAFSIAIRAQTDILLLDEVLAVGDAAFQQKCFDYFEDLKKQKKTVVFVSHDMGAIKRFCTRAIYVDKGQITLQGDPADIADAYAVDNIRDSAPVQSKNKTDQPKVALSRNHRVASKIVEQTDKGVRLEVSYTSDDKEKMYIGIAVTRDGQSLGEITTSLKNSLTGSGKVTYFLDTSIFNGGTYQIAGISLFKLRNRELLALSPYKHKFIIKGSDMTRGSAVKLTDTWSYE